MVDGIFWSVPLIDQMVDDIMFVQILNVKYVYLVKQIYIVKCKLIFIRKIFIFNCYLVYSPIL